MDNHICTSKVTGDTVLLACPENAICDEYLLALKEHFGLENSCNKTQNYKI